MGSKKKKVVIGLLATATGVSLATAATSIIAYEKMFPRVERPDYTLTPGEYCYERVQEKLPRTEFYYTVNDVKLKGYYYASAGNKGLVVVSHGMRSGGDDYLPIVTYMVNAGYNVFSYNCQGTYESEGDDLVGMCQSLIDLEGTIDYIQSVDSLAKMPLFLIGHSWGGYAATSVLSLRHGIRACASIAAMHDACMMMTEKAEEYVGKIGKFSEPVFHLYQKLIFEEYTDCNAIRGINQSNIPVLVAHGRTDKTVTYAKQSIIAHRDEITNPYVTYYVGEGLQGSHTGIWHSLASEEYQLQVRENLRALEKEKGGKLTYEEKAAFYGTVNHALYSEVNAELMDQIVKMFDKNL